MSDTELYGFFDAVEVSGVYDRVYKAEDFARLFSMFIGNGIFAIPENQLKVVAKTGLTVTVKKGRAFINGYWYELTEDKDITLSVNTTSSAVNYVISVLFDKASRKIGIAGEQITGSITPKRTDSQFELILAAVQQGVGVTSITDASITDYRLNDNYCGIVTGLVEQVSFLQFYLQQQAQFYEWFNSIKGKLSEDVAGSLQEQITSISENVSALSSNVQQLSQTVSSIPMIRSGSADPDNSVGKDGDVYIKVSE